MGEINRATDKDGDKKMGGKLRGGQLEGFSISAV